MEEEAAERKLNRPSSSAIESFPRDLLRRLSGDSCCGEQREASGGGEAAEEVVELNLNLNLGLSLGGCFGVDPEGNKLVRSSSMASFSLPSESEFPAVPRDLMRTCSLPSEAEEERRKRKELQGLRRLEAKKKRLSKRNSIKLGSVRPDEGGDERKKALVATMAANGCLDLPIGSQFKGVFSVSVPPGLPAWTAGSRSTVASHGSAGSQGSSSQGALELERQTSAQDFSNTSTVHSASGHEAVAAPHASEAGRLIASASGEHVANLDRMGEMPCVFTKGDGPNGRRIEGFLYNYKRGEDVRIVCICHGSFLTPAEFVKHAGGGDVANPMRHIVVCSSSAAQR